MNKRLRQDAFSSPVYHIAIIILLTIGLVSMPIDYIFGLFVSDGYTAKLLGGIILRAVLSVLAVVVIFKYGFNKIFKTHNGLLSFVAVIPALLIAINNFPINALVSGKAVIFRTGTDILLYVLYCISVGVFEELVYCGLIFPLFLYIFRNKKYSVVYAVAFSSACFALSHLTNLLGGADIGSTVMQVGYSFLIGAMCCIAKCITRNLFTAIFMHTVYDLGGLILNKTVGLGVGNQWDKLTIIITIVLAVLVAVYMVMMAFRIEHDEVESLYFEKSDIPEK